MFADRGCDRTPPSARSAATVLFAPYSRDVETTNRCAAILTEPELKRAARFLCQDAKVNFVQRRAFRRYCGAVALQARRAISEVAFSETAKGRPYLSDLPSISFSFSSCRFGFVGAWSSTHEIGVDIEDMTRDIEAAELAERFFTNAESNAVQRVAGQARLRTFYQFWSLKEASLKSIGEGLPFGLDTYEFELAPNPRVVHAPREYGEPAQFDAHLIEGAHSCGALVIRGTPTLPPPVSR